MDKIPTKNDENIPLEQVAEDAKNKAKKALEESLKKQLSWTSRN